MRNVNFQFLRNLTRSIKYKIATTLSSTKQARNNDPSKKLDSDMAQQGKYKAMWVYKTSVTKIECR